MSQRNPPRIDIPCITSKWESHDLFIWMIRGGDILPEASNLAPTKTFFTKQRIPSTWAKGQLFSSFRAPVREAFKPLTPWQRTLQIGGDFRTSLAKLRKTLWPPFDGRAVYVLYSWNHHQIRKVVFYNSCPSLLFSTLTCPRTLHSRASAAARNAPIASKKKETKRWLAHRE